MYAKPEITRNEIIYQEKILHIFGHNLPFEPRADCTLDSLSRFVVKNRLLQRETEQNNGKQMAGTERRLFLSHLCVEQS